MKNVIALALCLGAACATSDEIPRLATTPAAAPAAAPATGEPAAPRRIELTVTKQGFEPSPVSVKKGQPLELVVTRKTEETCARDLIIPGYDIQQPLPLDQPVTIRITPKKSGQLRYGCGMDQMISGVLLVD